MEQLQQLREDRDSKMRAWELKNMKDIEEMKAQVERAQREVDEAQEERCRTQQRRQVIAAVQAVVKEGQGCEHVDLSCGVVHHKHEDKVEDYYSDDFEDGSDEDLPNHP